MHILAFEKELSCHLYTFEGQFHIIYSFGKRPQAISWQGYIFKKAPNATYPQIFICWKAFFCHSFTLCKVSLRPTFTYIHTIERCFPCYLYSDTYTYHWKVFSMLPLCKVSNMGQPKFEQKLSQANPNFHVFLTLKPNFGFLAISMFPCIEATSLGS